MLSDEQLGQLAIDAIIEGAMIEADCDNLGHFSGVLLWDINAPEQLGAAIRCGLKKAGLAVVRPIVDGPRGVTLRELGKRRSDGDSGRHHR